MLKIKMSRKCKQELIEAFQIAIAHYRADLGRGLLDDNEIKCQISRMEMLLTEIELLETKGTEDV